MEEWMAGWMEGEQGATLRSLIPSPTPPHPYTPTPTLLHSSTVIEAILDQKLVELLGDPDEGLLIRKDVRERLLRQKHAVAAGKWGQELAEVHAIGHRRDIYRRR